MSTKAKLYCYAFRISANGSGRLTAYEVTVNSTPCFYTTDPDSRCFPDHSERIRKNEIEQIYPMGFERFEYYLISERSDREGYFRNEVTNRLIQELEKSLARTDRIKRAMNIQTGARKI